MSRSKPTAGYRTQSEACAALAREGLTSAEIGARLGIATTTASSSTAYRLGPGGINRPPRPTSAKRRRRTPQSRPRPVLVDHDVLEAFAPHAARRGIDVTDLVHRLLGTIAHHRWLIDNVLDDGAADARPAAAAAEPSPSRRAPCQTPRFSPAARTASSGPRCAPAASNSA